MVENQCSQVLFFATGTVLLLITGITSVVSGQPAGVYLSLNGVTIPSDGYVRISDIDINDAGLLCNTDRISCCRSSDPDGVAQGHWYYPDGTQVESFTQEVAIDPTRNFFSRNRGTGVVRLNRSGNPPERGRFRCEVPNADGINVTMYVNIVDSIPPPTTGPPITTPSQHSTTTDQTMITTATVITQTNATTAALPPTTRGLGTPPPAIDAPSIVPTATPITTSTAMPIAMPITMSTAMPTTMPTAMPTAMLAITVSPITSSGNATAGESYRLECTVTVTGSNDQPTITWLMGSMDNMITSGVVTTGSMSTLTFDPLAASHAGTYTCRAMLGSAMDSASRTITVQNPAITVSVASSVATPTVGSMYSLTCNITGAERLLDADVMVTYQWVKNGAVVSGQTMATLSLSPLTLSAAGSYTCQATVTSSLLSDPITTASSNPFIVRLTLPRPAAIRVSTNEINPLAIRPIGSTVTLTCMADLDPAIDVPVIVNIELSDPAGIPLTATAPSVSGSTYSRMATVSSFGRNDSGLYTCSATISPSSSNSFISDSSSQSETLRVTVGVYLSLKGVVYASNTSIPITEIGTTSNTGLQCITDRMPCCGTQGSAGEWLFPDGTTIPGPVGNPTSFIRTRGDDGTVNLNRLNINVPMPTGLFCCEVPDALNVMQRLCANITTSITVQITGSGATPSLGQSYSLSCEVAGANDPISAYQWRKDGTVLSETGTTLSFSSLSLSDAGQYTCQVSMDGIMFNSTRDIILTIPPPLYVSVTSTPSSPVNATTSSVTVNCVVELGPSVLESELSLLMVGAQLFRDGTQLTLTAPTMRGTAFTYTTQLNSFGRSDSGNYTCTATVRPQPTATYLAGSSSLNNTAEITIGVFLTLGGQHYHNGSSILIGQIGEGDDGALLCVTDLIQCCRGEDTPDVGEVLGEWFYPNGSLVRIKDSGDDFYRDRDPGIVRLNRRNNATSPVGQFCCVVPDATFTNKTTCINIVLDSSTTPSNPTTVPSGSSVMVQVNFQLVADKESMNISFSLTCNSTGGVASGVIWTRDGFLLRNTNPLVETDASTLSYTSVLTVSGRTPGTYTCTIRGTSDQDLSSANFIVQASVPPMDVVATQSSSSAPVEVSWSPPSDATPAIIGYRIFFGNGQNLLVPSYVTRIVVNFMESSQIESVSVRSESTQLPSELITATVTAADEQSLSETPCTCSGEVGTAVGVMFLVVGIIAAVTAITVVICWSVMRRRKSGMNNFTVSANMAYGDVKLEALGDVCGEYEDADKLVRSGRGGRGGGGNYETIRYPSPYEFPVSKPEAPLYATADDTTKI